MQSHSKQQMQAVSPKYRLMTSNKSSSALSLKENKNLLQSMELQLQKSRMAVTNITTFRNTQQHLKKKLNDIQGELHQTMIKIDSQTKRQKVLADLIAMLKGQMCKLQAKQKADQQKNAVEYEKKVKKVQYDIEQILQKHNQQIAKISLLKEQANSSRSERVVYSNLFKKLESEIKHYEEIYKDELLKTEALILNKSNQSSNLQESFDTKYKQRNTQSGSGPNSSQSSLSQPNGPNLYQTNLNFVGRIGERRQTTQEQSLLQSTDNQLFSQSNNFLIKTSKFSKEKQLLKGPSSATGNCFFLTCGENKQRNNSITSNRPRKSQKLSWNQGQRSPENSKTMLSHHNTSNNVKNTLASISQYERQVQKVKIYAECDSVSQIIEHYSTLESQNQNLLETIELLNEQICHLQDQNNSVTKDTKFKSFAVKAMRSSALINVFGFKGSSNNILESERCLKPRKSTYFDENIQKGSQCSQQQTIEKLFEILSVFTQQSNETMPDQCLEGLDWKIDCLLQETKHLSQGVYEYQQRQQTLVSEPMVECLLDKMEKFSNCQKILDKASFQNEYFKEISRGKKSTKLKKTVKNET